MEAKQIDAESDARETISSLIKRSAKGEHTAFSRLYGLTRGKMRKTVPSVLPSTADIDDVLQDAYVKVWRNAASFDPAISSPISWMSVIVRNTALDAARRKKLTTTDLELAETIADVPDDPDHFDYAFAQRIADNVLSKLPDDRRRLLSLAYLDGHSRETLAHIFGAPSSTIKTWLRRTLEGVKTDCAAVARRPALALAVTRQKR